MNNIEHFNTQLKRAAQRRKLAKPNSQVTTITGTATTIHTKVAKTKMSDDLYRTLIVAKAIKHIKQRGV